MRKLGNYGPYLRNYCYVVSGRSGDLGAAGDKSLQTFRWRGWSCLYVI